MEPTSLTRSINELLSSLGLGAGLPAVVSIEAGGRGGPGSLQNGSPCRCVAGCVRCS